MCPCFSLRVSAGLLAFAACVAASARVLFGADASAFLNAALAGNVAPVVWCWGAIVVAGLWQGATGLNAALSHRDPIRTGSLLWSAVAIWLATYYFPHAYGPPDFTPWNWAALHAVLTAWVAEHAANVWLQLRGLFMPRRRPALVAAPSIPGPPGPMMTRRTVVEETYYGGEVHVRTWEPPPSSDPSAAPGQVPLIKHDGHALPTALPPPLLIRRRVR